MAHGGQGILVWTVRVAVLSLVLAVQPVQANDKIWEGLFRYQQQMAQLGNAEAQYKLGEHYEQGLGVDQDLEQAKAWYEKAAVQGYEPAKNKLKGLKDAKSAPSTPAADPADEQLAREHKARLQAQAELARIQAERIQMEQELVRQREELQRMKEEKARENAAPPVVKQAAQPAAQPAPVVDKTARGRQRQEAIEKAEAEYRRALERRVAKERLELEMQRLQSTPIGYDN